MARQATATAGTKAGRSPALLLVAVLAGVLAAALMLAYLNNQSKAPSTLDVATEGGEVAPVVVVKRDIPYGTKLTEEMLEVRALPVAALLSGAISDPRQVVGKVTTAPLVAGEQIVPSKVSAYSGQDTLSYRVPAGRRAVSLQVPHEAWATAGLAQPGDYVDVLAVVKVVTVDPQSQKEVEAWQARIVAANVPVLAVAQSLVKVVPKVDEQGNLASDPVGGYRPTGGETFEKAISITLGLTPEEAAAVAIVDAMNDSDAQFRILVRQTGDTTAAPGTLWDLDDFLGGRR